MTDHTVVSIFLRGGMDGLSYLVPHTDPDYLAARPDIAIPTRAVLPLDDTFGLHPGAEPLMDIWDAGQLALIPACGSTDSSRSHFDAMAIMESAAGPGERGADGWVGRLANAVGADQNRLGGIAIGRMVPRSLAGYPAAVGIAELSTYELGAIDGSDASTELLAAIRSAYPDPPIDLVTSQGRAVFDVLSQLSDSGLAGAPVPDNFGPSPVAADLWQAAQIVAADIGTRAITVDWGGWDHHDNLGTFETGDMVAHVAALAAGLRGFWDHLVDHHDNLTVVVMTEFGRRLAQNSNGGTDHGHGGVMTVLGGGLNGGVLGNWVGLGSEVLDRGDVPVLTDYRHVLAEIIDRRMGIEKVSDVLPNFATEPTGYVGLAD